MARDSVGVSVREVIAHVPKMYHFAWTQGIIGKVLVSATLLCVVALVTVIAGKVTGWWF